MHKDGIHTSWFIALVFACLTPLAAPATCQSKSHPCLRLKDKIYSFDALRQGKSYDVTLQLEAYGCELPVDANYMPPEFSLQADVPEGLQAEKAFAIARPVPLGNMERQRLSATIRVTALPDAQVGERIVPATIRYRAVDAQGNTFDESLSVEVPVKVLAANGHVKARKVTLPPEEGGPLKWYQVLVLVVAFPIAFLIYLSGEC